jgi:hypothetical protein
VWVKSEWTTTFLYLQSDSNHENVVALLLRLILPFKFI